MLSFPGTDIDGRLIVKGAGRLFLAPFAASGADGTPLTPVGATKGGVGVHYARSNHYVDTDQYLAEVEAFPVKEEVMVKFTFLQMNLAQVFAIIGTADQTLAGGGATDASSSLTFGQSVTKTYRQLILRMEAPPGATNGQRVYQFWKTILHDIAEVKLEKTAEAGVQVTYKALADPTAVGAGKAAIFQVLDS